MQLDLPSHDGAGLVNLVAELERRLTGTAPSPGLAPAIAELIPEAGTYVLVLFDGLGDHQLDHPAGATLAAARCARLEAPFPTTTSVSLATVATGLPPTTHGTIGHLMWLPDLERVVNVLKWITPWGERVEFDTSTFLPAPNLWERLRGAGVEPVTVQPASFVDTPLTRALYRGCRFEPVATTAELAEATVQLAGVPRRLLFTYLPQVDFAAHVWGQSSREYADAVAAVDLAWTMIAERLPPGAVLLGTADHGLLDYRESDKELIRDVAFDPLVYWGDPRGLMVRGDRGLTEHLATTVGARCVHEEEGLWPPGPRHPQLDARLPDAVLLARRGSVLLPRGFDRRLTGYHGGLEPEERHIPLLCAAPHLP